MESEDTVKMFHERINFVNLRIDTLCKDMNRLSDFYFKENECRKSESDLLISSNKETHRRLIELEQYILR